MPFIVGGTAAAVLMNLIPLLDDRYAANPGTGTLVLFIVVLGLLLVAMAGAIVSYIFPSARWPPELAASARSSAASCCCLPALCWVIC